MQFINMAIVPFLISASMLNFFNLGGLIEEMNLIFAINAIVPHITGILVDIPLVQNFIKNWLLQRFLTRGKGGKFDYKVNRYNSQYRLNGGQDNPF